MLHHRAPPKPSKSRNSLEIWQIFTFLTRPAEAALRGSLKLKPGLVTRLGLRLAGPDTLCHWTQKGKDTGPTAFTAAPGLLACARPWCPPRRGGRTRVLPLQSIEKGCQILERKKLIQEPNRGDNREKKGTLVRVSKHGT